MSARTEERDAPGGPAGDPRGWDALRSLVRARLLVGMLALPLGLLLRPDAEAAPLALVLGAFLALCGLSALYALAIHWRRGLEAQIYVQLAIDLVAIAALAGWTGGQESQFTLFFALVVITGGVVGRMAGGLFAAAGACAAFLSLPWVSLAMTGEGPALAESLPRPGISLAFLVIVGVLSGVLGQRVQRAHADLARTARELDRVRVDNDVILRHLTTGVFTIDAEGCVSYMNPAAENVLGLRYRDIAGRPLDDALPQRLEGLRRIMGETLSGRAPRARVEISLETEAGRPLPIGASTSLLVHESHEPGAVAVFQDLTEVREMERRVRRSETLAEVGALAAGIAHELRNGLNPISGSVECLQRELTLDGENAVLMNLISRESQRLNRFVTDLLSYSKERDLALAPVDLGEHLAEVCEVVTRDPRRPAGVRVRIAPGYPDAVVKVDADQMRQVWLNLAANAFQAIEHDGEVVVGWRDGDADQVIIECTDNGPGIAAEDLPLVGQPFFTTKEGGTGLGLAIAQRIVERHGGALTLHSVPGAGTTVRVVLVRASAAVAQAAA
jgi:two-component system sensor histidine kinase PilS (NtrC family)